MKRDPILIHRILLALEEAPFSCDQTPAELRLDGVSQDDLAYHLLLLSEGGLIHSVEREGRLVPVRMTWKGHEYFDGAAERMIVDVAAAVEELAGS